MYSLIRVWIGLKLARMLIQLSVVVRTTRSRDSPSTPSLYWIPKSGIHDSCSVNWKRPPRPTLKPDQQHQRNDPGQECRAEGDGSRVARRQESHGERADKGQERDHGQDGEAVHRQCPTIRAYEPTITMSPIAIPSA